MHFKALAALSAIAAASGSVTPDSFSNKTAGIDPGTPAITTHVWTGPVNAETTTLYGNSVDDIVNQIHSVDPTATKADLTAAVNKGGMTLVAMDSGTPEDLPDIGVPTMPWKGVGGPFTDYNDTAITYQYSCGDFATGDEATVRQGAYRLRNMPGQVAFTPKGRCARQWCKDTTAMFVCNQEEDDLTIPQYNVGWMADRLHRLCCDDNAGKSGQMWHYKDRYSVVIGYANCNEDAATNEPYPYGDGNNQNCRGASPGLW